MQNLIKLNTPPLFNFDECRWFLDRGYDDCLYQLRPNRVRKALLVANEPVLFDILSEGRQLSILILSGDTGEETKKHLQDYMQHWFDLKYDLTDFYRCLHADSRTNYMLDAYKGLHLMGIPDLFESLAWCIIGQQINLAFAYRLKRRLVSYYGQSVNYEGEGYYLFPSAESMQHADPTILKEMQFSRSKISYLIELATAFAEKRISKSQLQALPNLEARLKHLTELKGVGVWTANYALMKSLQERSCIPYGDAGLINALLQLRVIENKNDMEGMRQFFSTFRGCESYLVFYLWRSLSARQGELKEV